MQHSLAVPVLLVLLSACAVGRIEGKARGEPSRVADASSEDSEGAGAERDGGDTETDAPERPEAALENGDAASDAGTPHEPDAFPPASDDSGAPLVDDGGPPNPLTMGWTLAPYAYDIH